MKKILTSVLSVMMAVALLCSAFVIPTSAAANTITYAWAGPNAYDAGFAQGTITVSVDSSSGGT